MIITGEAQLWPFERSVCVTQIFDEPRARTLNHWLCGGDMDDLLSHQGEVEAWARARGCNRLLMGGRRGWERVLKRLGFAPVGIVLAKAI
jgi:hypothetical protein